MEFESPVDAWYVWFGVAVASLAIAGVALSLPTQPSPDATGAANAIDRVAGSTQVAWTTVTHDADQIRLGTTRLSMRNEGGVTHAAVAFGPMTPVFAVDNLTQRGALRAILHGTPPATVLDRPAYRSVTEAELRDTAQATRETLHGQRPEWQPADGQLHVRTVDLDGEVVVLVGA